MPMIPCRPRLALINAIATNVSAFDHAGSPRISATEPCPLLNAVTAAAMVKSAWMNVPMKSQARVFAPMRSPMRPRDAPAMKVSTDVSACWSARWKEVSRWPGGPEKRRARARASWTELPVWKPHHTKMAEKDTESLGRGYVSG